MRIYEFKPFRLARVWTDELPPAIYELGLDLKTAVHHPNRRQVTRSRIALELYKYAGPRTIYGLLGALLPIGQRLCWPAVGLCPCRQDRGYQ